MSVVNIVTNNSIIYCFYIFHNFFLFILDNLEKNTWTKIVFSPKNVFIFIFSQIKSIYLWLSREELSIDTHIIQYKQKITRFLLKIRFFAFLAYKIAYNANISDVKHITTWINWIVCHYIDYAHSEKKDRIWFRPKLKKFWKFKVVSPDMISY